MHIEDFIILAIIFILIWIAIKSNASPFPNNGEPPKGGAAMKLLEANGYEVIAGKNRVPIDVETSERKYQSRIMVDFVAKKEDAVYVVKIKNKRKQERFSGSFLRDELLPLQLFFRVDGVLYIDIDKEKIHEVSFVYPNIQYKQSLLDIFKVPKWFIIVAVIAILIFILR